MSIEIKKIFQGMSASIESEGASHEFMSPVRDWVYILGVSILVLLGGVSYSIFDFYSQFGIPQIEDPVEGKQIRYRDKEVVMIATLYTEREAYFHSLRTNQPSTPEKGIESENPTDVLDTSEEDSSISEPLAETPVDEYTEGAPSMSP